ncbi:MAG: sulfite oxidase-like oxidoreductase [Candidatus Parvarchaeota archaeon]|nr:sulfite oxidase-like oxidoreductase [Candidatus Parvarchaeota archaeon]
MDSYKKRPAPGEHYIKDFIIYDALGGKEIDRGKWSLKLTGLVENKLTLSYADLLKRREVSYIEDFNCVTGWAVKDVRWGGVSLRDIITEAKPTKDAKWAMFKCADGYSTPVKLEDVLSDGSIIALKINDKPLTFEQGAPARPFIPSLYGWKSAKWLTEVELIQDYEDGYWERYGYHQRGRVAEEERFQSYEWKNIKKHVRRILRL